MSRWLLSSHNRSECSNLWINITSINTILLHSLINNRDFSPRRRREERRVDQTPPLRMRLRPSHPSWTLSILWEVMLNQSQLQKLHQPQLHLHQSQEWLQVDQASQLELMSKLSKLYQITSLHLLKTLLREDMLVFFSPLPLNKKHSSVFMRTWFIFKKYTTTLRASNSSPKTVVLVRLKLPSSMKVCNKWQISTHWQLNSLRFWPKTRDLCSSTVSSKDILNFINNSTRKRKLP